MQHTIQSSIIQVGKSQVYVLDTDTCSQELFNAELPTSTLQYARESFKSAKRQKEWWGIRLLLKSVCGEQAQIGYTPTGAPMLINSDTHISISHSGSLVALVFSEERIGLDLQMISDKPLRIKSHFLDETEGKLFGDNLDTLSAVKLWCAKEAVYKFLSIPETPLIGGITLRNVDGKIEEINYDLSIHFEHYRDAIFAVAYQK